METSLRTHETRFRVRYAETDQMGVVYHANYLIWMEVGRTEYCRSMGGRYRDMETEGGIVLAVVDARCRYLYPARYDDEVTITTWIESANRRVVEFGYAIRNEHGRELATGSTKHVYLGKSEDGPELRPVKLPAAYNAIFGLPTSP